MRSYEKFNKYPLFKCILCTLKYQIIGTGGGLIKTWGRTFTCPYDDL